MELRVLKEPRGFIRILEFFLAILAFACCVDFTTYMQYEVTCTHGDGVPKPYRHNATYPFK